MYNEASLPRVSQTVFVNNKGANGGTAFNIGLEPIFSQVFFSDNRAAQGGALYSKDSAAIMVNATFLDNYATALADALYNDNAYAVPAVINAIFWIRGAESAPQPQIYFASADSDDASKPGGEQMTLYNSIVQGGVGNLANGTATRSPGGAIASSSRYDLVTVLFDNIATQDPLLSSEGAPGTASPAVNSGLLVRCAGPQYVAGGARQTLIIATTIRAGLPIPH